FLSRGVKFASDATSMVDCMHPPSTRPPSRTAANPLIAIVFLVVVVPVAITMVPMLQLTEKTAPCLRVWRVCDHLPVDLLQECRSAPMWRTHKTTLAATA